ncbi:MAG: sigma-70 family RNA polymerase sigma factor [Chloroflexi bacterium]|nr:sigma-70 family RNA polymerase sigma factor [Chloroflexota bacterium]
MTHEYTLLVGGTILAGLGRPPVTSMAWAAGTIIALGSEDEIRGISRGDSEVLQLHGAFVVPLDPVGLIEIGGSADLAILATDRRGIATATRPIALIRGGHVVEGRLPTVRHRGAATDAEPAVFPKVMDNDDALAARLARDLDGAFPDLVADHADRLYSIALRLLGDPSDAEEVAQDALVRAHRAMAGYEAARVRELRLRPWLAAIAVNLARNRRRRYLDRHPMASLEPLTEAGFDARDAGQADPLAVTTARESADELATLLLELPSSLRAAVVLRHVDGMSIAEIAETLGRPEGTIKAHVSRGLDRLRVLLEAGPAPDRRSATASDRVSTTAYSPARSFAEVLR